MKTKVSKVRNQNEAKRTTIRVRETTKVCALAKLKEINRKDFGRALKLDDLFDLAVCRLTEEDVKTLREKSLSNEDRREILRQNYIAKRGPISKDAFLGLILSPDFQSFLGEQSSTDGGHVLPSVSAVQAG